MDDLDRLGWVAEHHHDLAGAQFVLRSTSSEFLALADRTLAQFRAPVPDASRSSWPVVSVATSLAAPTRPGVRGFHVGYLNHVEVFRYQDVGDAVGALLATIDMTARAQLAGRCSTLAVEAVMLDAGAVIVYGSAIRPWVDDLVAAGARPLTGSPPILDLKTGHLLGWPLQVDEFATVLDRRGRPLAPLARFVENGLDRPVPIVAVVRADMPAGMAEAVGELMCCYDPLTPEVAAFESVTALLGSVLLIQGAQPNPSAVEALLASAGRGVRRHRSVGVGIR